jgi:hypothetical protein
MKMGEAGRLDSGEGMGGLGLDQASQFASAVRPCALYEKPREKEGSVREKR